MAGMERTAGGGWRRVNDEVALSRQRAVVAVDAELVPPGTPVRLALVNFKALRNEIDRTESLLIVMTSSLLGCFEVRLPANNKKPVLHKRTG